MNREQIIDSFRILARSQGSYGRILNHLDNISDDERDDILSNLEKQNFKDIVDLVMFIEC
jgi:hypothetical protein